MIAGAIQMRKYILRSSLHHLTSNQTSERHREFRAGGQRCADGFECREGRGRPALCAAEAGWNFSLALRWPRSCADCGSFAASELLP